MKLARRGEGNPANLLKEDLIMTKFSHVIIRRPGKSLSNGITSAPELGQPIYERAIEEHYDYEHALEQCGVDVTVLPALEQYPDSCFVVYRRQVFWCLRKRELRRGCNLCEGI